MEEYYYNLPLPRFCDRQPATSHLLSPANVLGDFVLRFFRYDTLMHEPLFTLAHNTLFLEGNRLQLGAEDLYDVKDPSTVVTIEFEEVCECKPTLPFDERCYHCSTLTKTLKKDYSEMKQIINVTPPLM